MIRSDYPCSEAPEQKKRPRAGVVFAAFYYIYQMHGKEAGGSSRQEDVEVEDDRDWIDASQGPPGAAGGGGPAGYDGGEKLLDAGFFNAFEDDNDESDMASGPS